MRTAPLAPLVRRLMAKRPENRFQTAAEVVDSLTGISKEAGL